MRPPAPPGDRRALAALACLGLVVASLLLLVLPRPEVTHFVSADTRALIRGATHLAGCIEGPETWDCASRRGPPLVGTERTSVTDRFPLLLYLPTTAAALAGWTEADITRLVAVLSGASFLLLVALPWLVGRADTGLRRHRHLFAAVVVTGPLLAYTASTWSEVPAATAMAAAVAAATVARPERRRGLLVLAGLIVLAGISKENVPVIVALLCLAAAPRGGRRTPPRPVLVAIGAGTATAMFSNALFNQLRYRSWLNVMQLDPQFRHHDAEVILRQAWALIASPNGGILLNWPSWSLVSLALVVVLLRRLLRLGGTDRLGLCVDLGLVSLAVGVHLGTLAAWYAPFGGHAWGPRLTLPALPAVAVALAQLERRWRPEPVAPSPFGVAALLACCLAVLPQVGIRWNEPSLTAYLFAPPPACATAQPPTCRFEAAWGQRPLMLQGGLGGLGSPVPAATAGLALLAAVALVSAWAVSRRSAARPAPASDRRRAGATAAAVGAADPPAAAAPGPAG